MSTNILKAYGNDCPEAFEDLSNVDRLCDRCKNANWETAELYLAIADEWSFYPKVGVYSNPPTVQHIRNAAYSGCHLCSLILTCLLTTRYRYSIGVDPLPEGLNAVGDHTEVLVDVEAMANSPPVWLTIRLNISDPDGRLQDFSMPLTSITPLQVSSTLNISSPAEDIAYFWLQECKIKHKACSNEVPKMPTRIINVIEDTLRLVEPAGMRAEYATLSYMIGGVHLVTTTSANIDDRRRGFDIGILPQTIQDAVWWTRKLGLHYLWIDSLCILQDALSDWEIELSTMSSIYRNSTVTIAATRADTAHYGCAPNRNKLGMVPCRIRPNIIALADFGRRKWIYQYGALDSRSWCFQETQLAQRVLRVGGEEIAWQCRTCKRQEIYPTEERVHDIEGQSTFFGSRVLDAETRAGLREEPDSDPFTLWYTLIRAFANRHLTYPEDKLPAFSGMAEYFQKKLNTTYVSGLWKEDMFHGLLWRMDQPGHYIRYRAPSWSWAGVEGGNLMWDLHVLSAPTSSFVSEVIEVRSTVSGLNPFGRVTSAKLTIFGPVASVPSQFYEDDSDIGAWKWRVPLLRWDKGMPSSVGCVCLRLHERACLILAPNCGTYTRVGFVSTPHEPQSHTQLVIDVINGFEWEKRVVSIV